MDQLRIAVVGTGARAQAHLATIACLDDRYRLVGIADANQSRREDVAAACRVPGFGTAEEVLDETRPDVVLIAVPPDGHHPIAVLAAERGVHIVTEVPIAPTLRMADIMINAAQRHRVHLHVAENVWRWPTEALKRQAVTAGVIGAITQIHLWYGSGSYHGMSAVNQLMPTAAERALGVAGTVRTRERIDLMGHAQQHQSWELGVIEFGDGATCVYQQPVYAEHVNSWEIVGTEGYLTRSEAVLESDGRKIPYERRTEVIDGVERLVALGLATEPAIVWENPLRHYPLEDDDAIARAMVLTDLHSAILDGGVSGYSGVLGRRDQETLLALRESAHIGSTWVELPLTRSTRFEEEFHHSYLTKYRLESLDSYHDGAGTAYPRQGVSQYVQATR